MFYWRDALFTSCKNLRTELNAQNPHLSTIWPFMAGVSLHTVTLHCIS